MNWCWIRTEQMDDTARNKWPGNRGSQQESACETTAYNTPFICVQGMWSNAGPGCGIHHKWVLQTLKPLMLLLFCEDRNLALLLFKKKVLNIIVLAFFCWIKCSVKYQRGSHHVPAKWFVCSKLLSILKQKEFNQVSETNYILTD